MNEIIDIMHQIERRKRIKLLKEKLNLINKSHRVGTITTAQRKQCLIDLKELTKLERIDRAENDILYFMYEYFSDDRNPENEQNLIPSGVSIDDAPTFHRELCGLLDDVSNVNPTARIAWAAPRGHAKSAYLSNCFPVHQIVFKKRRYILVISETDTSAKKFIEWVSLQLKFNKKLREDFGEFLSPAKSLNLRDNQEAFLTTNGILVEAASMGKQLRGKRNGSYRPDLVICDDLESAKNTNTPELREKNLYWFNSVVIPIGDPSRTAFVYMGTIVHGRGLLPTILNRADFESRIYSAIVKAPEREDLWAEFEEIYRNPENEERLDDALAFYYRNQGEMEKGVEVLWPSRFSYDKLMMEKVNIGSRAFGSEFLNNPIDEDTQIFKPSMFTYFDWGDLKDKAGRPLSLDYTAWDIAFGKNSRSDYNAIVTVARDRRTGIIYVIDTWAKKCPAHEALKYYGGIVDKKYDPFKVYIETQNAEYVFPETVPGDANKILAFHIAFPLMITGRDGEDWILNVESHYPGFIEYRKYRMKPITLTVDNEITEWRIYAELLDSYERVETGVPFPLVIHVPNYATDESWAGIDDLSENKSIFDEINNRLSQIAVILDKHADPAIAVPTGTLGEDEAGNPIFRIGVDKVFEMMGKDDVLPQYITWDGQFQAAFLEVEKLIDILLVNAEVPAVALGRGDSGTSGSSGLSIKWRMNSLLAKINRKRQYYDKGLRRVLFIAQLLEQARLGKQGYEATVPKIQFADGLPDDEMEMATVAQIRTGGKATISQKTALMKLDGLTEEQADAELKRIKAEEAVADPSIFNNETPDLTKTGEAGGGQ